MTATANQYMTSRVEGLNPPTGTISTSSYAGMDDYRKAMPQFQADSYDKNRALFSLIQRYAEDKIFLALLLR